MARRIRWPVIASLILVMSACGDADVATQRPADVPVRTSTTAAVTTTAASTGEPSVWPTEGWQVMTPESQGMDSAALAGIVERLSQGGGVDSLTVIRNGYVVVDTVFHPFPPDTGHNLYSVSKSFVGTLIGIAIDRGLLAGVDVPVVDILTDAVPEEIDDRKAAMTIEDLLTMSSGLDCRDDSAFDYEGLAAMFASDDWTAHALGLPMAAEPGARFEYCNQATFLLSAILTEATGMPASEFAAEALFAPLDISEYEWPADPDGVTLGFSDLVLQRGDMAKLGYLYLRDGLWEGRRVISADWIRAATTDHIGGPSDSSGYGYQWWVQPKLGYAMAQGHGGQYVVVDPTHDLLVVVTASAAPLTPANLTGEIVRQAILSDDPLDPNSGGEAELAAAVALAAAGPEPRTVEPPAIAAEISGVRYRFRPNDLGFDSFVVAVGDQGVVLQLSDAIDRVRFVVGIDGRFALTDTEPPVAMRGEWLGENTFRIDVQTIGLAEPATVQLRFLDDRAHVMVSTPEMTEVLIADRVAGDEP